MTFLEKILYIVTTDTTPKTHTTIKLIYSYYTKNTITF